MLEAALGALIARTDWWLVKAGILAADGLLIALLLVLLIREPSLPRPAETLFPVRGRWLWRLALGMTVLGILGIGVLFLVALRAEPPK